MTMERQQDTDVMTPPADTAALTLSAAASKLAAIPEKARGLLLKMFVDPHVLEPGERAELIEQLRESISAHPEIAELRVLLGMALCVNLEVQEAIEELHESVRLAPNSFIAHLKMGELWMRLRVCRKAEAHTKRAASLAQNLAQAELARRQGAAIRTMLRQGIERGGYRSPFAVLSRLRRFWQRRRDEALAVADS
jgi:tetratricopeptide (TPR) repeat protein